MSWHRLFLSSVLPLALAACTSNDSLPSFPDAGDSDADLADAEVADAALPDAGDPDAAPNTPPTISTIDDQSTQFDPVGPVAFQIGDAETPVGSLQVTVASSDQAVLPDSNIELGGSGADRTLTLTPIASGTATVTVTVNDGTTNAFEEFLLSVTNAPPTTVLDSYAAFGNTEISVDSVSGVLANDSDDDGDTITVVADNIVSSMGGVVTIASDGSFTYLPPVGVTAATDSFEYQVTDGFEASTGNAEVSITEMIWYVDNSVAVSGDGRSSLAFATLAEAEAASDVGETIFVHQGDGTTAGMDEGIVLKDQQRLIGEAVGLSIGVTELIPAGGRPVITNTGGNGVRFAGPTGEILGFTIDAPAVDGINGLGVTDILIEDTRIVRAGSEAIRLGNSNPDGDVTLIIQGNSLIGNDGNTLASTQEAMEINVAGNGGGRLDCLIDNNGIDGFTSAMLLLLEGSTGTGAGGANNVVITNNVIRDLNDDGLQIEPDDTAVSTVTISGNTVDGVANLVGLAPARGLDFRVKSAAGGSTTAAVINNSFTDMLLEGALFLGSGANNAGTVVALVDNNSFTNNGTNGLRVRPDDDQNFEFTVSNNTMTGNALASSFDFLTGLAPVITLNLLNNEDDVGFDLERGTTGTFNLAGTLGQGQSFDDDNGNVANNGNTTGGAAPVVTILTEATPQQINIVDPATVTTP